MSKRSRTFQPSDARTASPDQGGQTAPGGSDPAPATSTAPVSTSSATTPPTGKPATTTSSRADARRRGTAPKPTANQSFFDRYKLLIIGGAGVVVVLFALLFVTRQNTAAYECATLLTPPPAAAPASGQAPTDSAAPASPAPSAAAASPAPTAASASPAPSTAAPATSASPGTSPSPTASAAPAATPLLGFQTSDMGKNHVVQGSTVKFGYCPPASGSHYNLGGGQAPLTRRLYGPDDGIMPQQWIHNLEHGYVVLLYRGEVDTGVLDQLQSVMDEAEVSDWSTQNCGPVNKVIGVRFDEMDPSVNFAAIAWDRVLLLEDLDSEQLLTFANQWQDGPQTPERVCG